MPLSRHQPGPRYHFGQAKPGSGRAIRRRKKDPFHSFLGDKLAGAIYLGSFNGEK